MSTQSLAVHIEHLTKKFGSVVALDDFSLDINPGELVALLGPSGCGKTTALRIVAGLEKPTAGQITINGEDISGLPANKRNMGMVFQAYSLFPSMTAEENVAYGLRVRGVKSAQRLGKARELLELVGLGSQFNRLPNQLSGGQQQRVALARALAIEPSVLLLDEPLSALDAKVRTQLRDEIKRIQVEVGTTTIFVTHDQEEALEVADRVVLMNQGKVEQIGSPSEVYDHPKTPFVYGFLGNVNRFNGYASGKYLEVGGYKLPINESFAKGSPLIGFARPHELDINQNKSGIAANVDRILSFGLYSRIELTIDNQQEGLPAHLEVQIERAELDKKKLKED